MEKCVKTKVFGRRSTHLLSKAKLYFTIDASGTTQNLFKRGHYGKTQNIEERHTPFFVLTYFALYTQSPLRSYRSVVILQMNHVVCFGVGTVPSASFVNQRKVQLLFLSLSRRSDGVLLFGCFLNAVLVTTWFWIINHCFIQMPRLLGSFVVYFQRGRSHCASIPGPR